MDEAAVSGRQSMDVHTQDIWLDKAEVCLSMGLYQPARQLLAEAHFVATVSLNRRRPQFQKQYFYTFLAYQTEPFYTSAMLTNSFYSYVKENVNPLFIVDADTLVIGRWFMPTIKSEDFTAKVLLMFSSIITLSV